VHANLPALEAVLAQVGSVDETVFLGDLVGYGPHPSACIDLLRDLGVVAVLGNHDAAVLAVGQLKDKRSRPTLWDEWSFDQLDALQTAYLASLPESLPLRFGAAEGQAMHHPAGAAYLHPDMPDLALAQQLGGVKASLILCGHTHRWIDRTVDGLRYICIPSIGQPRDRDTRAAYVIEIDGALSLHRVGYDLERVARDIQAIGLEETFCQRWIGFLRTAYDPEWSREYRPGGDSAPAT
jgi:predicted phosphodiesterase